MARVHFLNVNDGDCSIIQHENGDVTMIDVCNARSITQDAGGTQLLENKFSLMKGNFNQKENPTNPIAYLNSIGVTTIFRYIQTHPDLDHMDGLSEIHKNFSIINFWDVDNDKKLDLSKSVKYHTDWKCYQQLRDSKENPKSLYFLDGASQKYFRMDDNGLKKDDYLQVLAPTKDLINIAKTTQNWNDSSYVILYCIHGKRILFCGDADKNTILHIMAHHKLEVENLDVLIAPHHGRDSGKDFSFLDIMKPRVTFLGNANSEYLAYNEWNNRNLVKFTNNQLGNVVIDIDSKSFALYASNKLFVDKFREENHRETNIRHNKLENMWLLWKIE